MTIGGEFGIDTGVLGNIIDGDPALEYSNECECESGGVWRSVVSHASCNVDQLNPWIVGNIFLQRKEQRQKGTEKEKNY